MYQKKRRKAVHSGRNRLKISVRGGGWGKDKRWDKRSLKRNTKQSRRNK